MKLITWEYIAGFFDGEGCIWINKKFNENKRKGRNMVVHVGQIEPNRRIIDLISQKLKEENIRHSIVTIANNPKSKNKYVRIQIQSMGECKRFIEFILQYLIVKKEDAIEALDYISKAKYLWLTNKEKEDIKEMKNNYSAKEIAQIMGRSYVTINNHINRINL